MVVLLLIQLAIPGHGTKIILTSPARHPPSVSHTLTQRRTAQGNLRNRHTGIERETIGILIVDDHEVLREGLKGLLETVPEFQVLGEAADGKQALDLARKLSPDVVLMDVNLKEETGIQVTETLVSNLPDIRVRDFIRIKLPTFKPDAQYLRHVLSENG